MFDQQLSRREMLRTAGAGFGMLGLAGALQSQASDDVVDAAISSGVAPRA